MQAARVYLKTPNAPGQRTFSRCAAPFFLEIRQYSCEKMSCSAQKFLAAGHIGSFQIHPSSEAKGAQRHAVLAANFLHRSVNVINSNLQQSNVYTCDCVWSCSTNHAEKAYGSCRDTFCGSFAASGEGPVGDAGFRGIEIPEEYACPERNAHYREIPMKITTSRPLRKCWTPYAELQRRKADGWKGLQEQRRASGACGVG